MCITLKLIKYLNSKDRFLKYIFRYIKKNNEKLFCMLYLNLELQDKTQFFFLNGKGLRLFKPIVYEHFTRKQVS